MSTAEAVCAPARPGNTPALLSAHGLVVGYTAPVCRPVSFRLCSGETVGLAGPNGAGKSTLLQAVTGGARIFAGSVRREPGIPVAVLDQQPEAASECPLTGADLLRVCDARATPPPESLRPLLGRRLDALSGGQNQLLRVWSCLGGDAGLVLLDEPTNHLDPSACATLTRILLQGRGDRGLLIVSHDRDFLDRVCDRVVDVTPTPAPASGP